MVLGAAVLALIAFGLPTLSPAPAPMTAPTAAPTAPPPRLTTPPTASP